MGSSPAYGFAAARLTGYGIGPSLSRAVMAAFIGAVPIVVNALVH